METNTKFVVCYVCGGKGGWKKDKRTPLDSNWVDCPYCDGYGFIKEDAEQKNNEALIHTYNHYKKIITELLTDEICSVQSFTTEDMGKTIVIKIIPYDKKTFQEFVSYLLKFGAYSKTLKVDMIQKHIFDKKTNKFYPSWELVLYPDNLEALDGFIDLIKLWDKRTI
jgi:hypothetical protein